MAFRSGRARPAPAASATAGFCALFAVVVVSAVVSLLFPRRA
jgi:hypothetical protein